MTSLGSALFGPVDLATTVGTVGLPNPVMTASGTAGHGAELGAYGPLGELGAVVVKSLTATPWPGNPAPRVHQGGGGMLNSVGLQGPGMARWLEEDLPQLLDQGSRVVVSIWGHTSEEFAHAADLLRRGLADANGSPGAPRPVDAPGVVAAEVNVSCPNLEQGAKMFAHSPEATAAAVSAAECGLPRWAKLSPNVSDITEVAAAAVEAGAEGLTLVNTLAGMALDPRSARPVLGGGAGGLSGPPLRPVAVRAVFECRRALPRVAIIGVGGVARGAHAAELLAAGADAVQVGTATFADPRAPWRVRRELERWCRRHRLSGLSSLRQRR